MSRLIEHSLDATGVILLELRDAAGRNALHEAFVDELLVVLGVIASEPRAKVVVLAGLPDVFCSGAPKELLLRLATGHFAPADIVLAGQVLALPVPVISAMEGHASGGGLALGLCADIVVAARESRYGCTFMDMGFTPGMGMTALLEHALSPAVAHELLYSGELRRGSDLGSRGGVNAVVPRAEVRRKALAIALQIAQSPRTQLIAWKQHLALRRRSAFEASRSIEALMHDISFADPETLRRIQENFAG